MLHGQDPLASLTFSSFVTKHSLFKGEASIPSREIGYILRSLGQNPTEDDLLNLLNEAGMDSDSYLTRGDFVNVGIVAMEKQANRVDDVRAAFR